MYKERERERERPHPTAHTHTHTRMSKVWARTTRKKCHYQHHVYLALTAVNLREVVVSWILISNLGEMGDNESAGNLALECN